MTELESWIEKHCSIHPYGMSVRKCEDESCCNKIRAPKENGIRDLIMQRIPTPILDKTSPDGSHFHRYEEAIKLFGKDPKSFTDLSCLPSALSAANDKDKLSKTEKVKRDAKVTKELGLRSWDAKKVFATVNCFACMKPRCLFTNSKDSQEFLDAREKLKQKLEEISHRYSCGDIIIGDDEPGSKVIGQRQNLTCLTPVEKAYYNINGRSFKTKDVCIHCAETGSIDFLYRQTQLQQMGKINGKTCYPICKNCIESGLNPVVKPKSKTKESQKQKESGQNKNSTKKAKL